MFNRYATLSLVTLLTLTAACSDTNNGPPPACALNDCLQCDEDEAGPVFKAVAGRTRRRSGLESAIARPCSKAK